MTRKQDQGGSATQAPPANDEDETAGDAGEQQSAAAAPRGKRKRRLRDVADEALKGEAQLMVADPASARIRAVFSGNGVEADRADLGLFADSIKRLARFFTSLTESQPQLYALNFGKSVEVEIGPAEEEVERASRALAAAEAGESDAVRIRREVEALPETTLAGFAARDLLLSSEEDVVGAALSYGTEVTDTFKSLVRHLAEDDISLRLSLPTDTDVDARGGEVVVELDSERAQVYKEALTAVGTDETVKVKVAGTLTMADSASRQIRVTLDPKSRKPPELKNRRAITARYSAKAGREIKAAGLWDKEVIADFEMTRDRRGTTAHLRQPTFLLVGARARYE
jgi:hypothetical protein